MVSPFTAAYAVLLGASQSDMGWFQSSTNLSNNVMQVFWGRLSDKLQRRAPFIIIGSLLLSVFWIPMIFVANAQQLIAILAAQALIGSMATPAITAMIGDLAPSLKLGRTNAMMNLYTTIGSVVATVASGVLLIATGRSPQEVFFIPLAIAAVFGIASSLLMIKIKESKNGSRINLKRDLTSDLVATFACAGRTPRFVRYCYVEGTYQFFMSIAWPLLAITQVTVLNATMLQIALLTVAQSVAIIVFQGWAGRLADTIGRKPLLVLYRFSLVTVPLAYAVAPSMDVLIVIGVFWGFTAAIGQAAIMAYLLDVAPRELRGSFTAVFNLVIGVTSFAGSLIGGYLSSYTVGIFGLIAGMQIVYVISTVGRATAATLYMTLKETLEK